MTPLLHATFASRLRMYDDACPVSHSQIAFRELRSRGVPCEMVLYPGEFHGWRRPANQLDGDQRVLHWFRKWLMPSIPKL